jgi:hypothetical protein
LPDGGTETNVRNFGTSALRKNTVHARRLIPVWGSVFVILPKIRKQ